MTNSRHLSVRQTIKIAAILGVAGGLSIAALFPYITQVIPKAFESLSEDTSFWALLVAQTFQGMLLLGLLSYLGLRMGQRVRLGAPWLGALIKGKSLPRLPLGLATITGVSAASVILALDFLFRAVKKLETVGDVRVEPSAWSGFLASFYGAIGEEIELRLFLLTLIVWGLSFLVKQLMPKHFWMAIIFSALIFGAGHLPAAISTFGAGVFPITRTIVLNAVAGLVFGWLFWKKGLEVAMVSHFSADMVLHVIAPVVATTLFA